MKIVQLFGGVLVAMGLLWLGVTQYLGREIYASLPPVLGELPWSTDPKQPAHVPTALFIRPCGELRANEDLLVCLRRAGMKVANSPEGQISATFASGVGFSPAMYQLTWKSVDGALPDQLDAVRD